MKKHKQGKHIRFDNEPMIDNFRRKHGYKTFAEFIRQATMYFIGFLSNEQKTKKIKSEN